MLNDGSCGVLGVSPRRGGSGQAKERSGLLGSEGQAPPLSGCKDFKNCLSRMSPPDLGVKPGIKLTFWTRALLVSDFRQWKVSA